MCDAIEYLKCHTYIYSTHSAKAPYDEASYNKPYLECEWYVDNNVRIWDGISYELYESIFGIDFDFDICDRLYEEKSILLYRIQERINICIVYTYICITNK